MVNNQQKSEMLKTIQTQCAENDYKLLYAAITGSHSYGMATENSDIDARFVFAAKDSFYLGFTGKDSFSINGEDVSGYEFKKFIWLAYKNNPSVLEMLFIPDEFVLFTDDLFKIVLEQRDKFLSKLCYNTYLGYAQGQIEKAKTCTKPIIEELENIEEGLRENFIDPKMLSIKQAIRDVRVLPGRIYNHVPTITTIGELIDYYKFFKQSKWPYNDLGNKRIGNVKKYGYDTKNISHAVRLIRTCHEIMTVGKLQVLRHDADYLLRIKQGGYPLEILEEEVIMLEEMARKAKEMSKLPDIPDLSLIEHLTVNILKQVIS